MKIALVNPPPFGIFEPQYDTPSFTRLSLASLAGYLRIKNYSDLLLIDAKYERLNYSEIKARLKAFGPDVVGHTAFTNEVVQAARVATLVRSLSRELKKEIVNVLGGVHGTSLPEETLREFPDFDFLAVGEGEQTLLELIQYLDGQHSVPLHLIPGLAYRDPNQSNVFVVTNRRQNIADQTLLPMPAWDLLPASPTCLVMSARGCPYTCNFCQNPNGRIVRKRGVDQFLNEIEWLVQRNNGKITLNICDEILTIDKARTHAILDGMMDLGFGKKKDLKFIAQTHVNTVDEPLLRKIAQAGCESIGFGLESGDDEIVRASGKGTNISHIRKIMKLAKKTDVPLLTYFILGQPNETVKTAMKSVRLAIQMNPQYPIFGIMVPYPGTKIWDWAMRGEMGYRLKSRNWNDYNKQIGNALEFEGINRKQIEILQLVGYCLVFLCNLRIGEFCSFAWKYRTEGVTVLKKILYSMIPRKHLAKHHIPLRAVG